MVEPSVVSRWVKDVPGWVPWVLCTGAWLSALSEASCPPRRLGEPRSAPGAGRSHSCGFSCREFLGKQDCRKRRGNKTLSAAGWHTLGAEGTEPLFQAGFWLAPAVLPCPRCGPECATLALHWAVLVPAALGGPFLASQGARITSSPGRWAGQGVEGLPSLWDLCGCQLAAPLRRC